MTVKEMILKEIENTVIFFSKIKIKIYLKLVGVMEKKMKKK